MRAKLTDTISVAELQKMRDTGMSNREIAESLDVSYQTICRYLGKAPKELRKPYEHKWEVTQKGARPIAEQVDEPLVPARLVVDSQITELVSEYHHYVVDHKSGMVEIDNQMSMLYEDIDNFIAELTAIRKKLGESRGMALQVW